MINHHIIIILFLNKNVSNPKQTLGGVHFKITRPSSLFFDIYTSFLLFLKIYFWSILFVATEPRIAFKLFWVALNFCEPNRDENFNFNCNQFIASNSSSTSNRKYCQWWLWSYQMEWRENSLSGTVIIFYRGSWMISAVHKRSIFVFFNWIDLRASYFRPRESAGFFTFDLILRSDRFYKLITDCWAWAR